MLPYGKAEAGNKIWSFGLPEETEWIRAAALTLST